MKSLLSCFEVEVNLERRRGHYNIHIHNTCMYVFFFKLQGNHGETVAGVASCVFISEKSNRRFKNTKILTVKDPITEHMPI